jgi:hypothetical protein
MLPVSWFSKRYLTKYVKDLMPRIHQSIKVVTYKDLRFVSCVNSVGMVPDSWLTPRALITYSMIQSGTLDVLRREYCACSQRVKVCLIHLQFFEIRELSQLRWDASGQLVSTKDPKDRIIFRIVLEVKGKTKLLTRIGDW